MHVPPEHLFDPPPPSSHARSLLLGRLPSSGGSSLSSVSSFSSNFFLHRVRPIHPRVTRATAGEGIGPSPSPRCRQVYFYSIRFIRLNMTCGYNPGDIFPILRDDIPTPVVPRVSCILCPYRPSAPARCRHPPTAGKIRTILSRIIAASGEFMVVPACFLAARVRERGAQSLQLVRFRKLAPVFPAALGNPLSS